MAQNYQYSKQIQDEIEFINLHTQERQEKFSKAMANYEKAIQAEIEIVNNNNNYFDTRNEIIKDEIEKVYKKFQIRNTNLSQKCKKLYELKNKLCKELLKNNNEIVGQYHQKIQEKIDQIEIKLDNQRRGIKKKDTAKEYQIKRQKYEGLKELSEIEQKTNQFEQQIFNELSYIPEINKYTKYQSKQINLNENVFLEYVDNQPKCGQQIQIEQQQQQEQLQQWQMPQLQMHEQNQELLNQFQMQQNQMPIPIPQMQFIQQEEEVNKFQRQPSLNDQSFKLQIFNDPHFQRSQLYDNNAIQSEEGIQYLPNASRVNNQQNFNYH